MKDALRRRMRYILGGDFNFVFNHGDRGVLLNSLIGQFDLSLSNNPDFLNFDKMKFVIV